MNNDNPKYIGTFKGKDMIANKTTVEYIEDMEKENTENYWILNSRWAMIKRIFSRIK